MIRSFRDRDTERVFQGQPTTAFPPNILKAARRKLDYLNQTRRLQDLLVPAGNRLEALKGNRAGQWSIRINDRVPAEGGWCVFAWSGITPSSWRSLTTIRKKTVSQQPSPAERIPVSHPGETLREDFLIPMSQDAGWLAEGPRLPVAEVEELLAEKRPITAETALRLSRFLGTSAEIWMGLQEHFDLENTRARLAPELHAIQPCRMPHLVYGENGQVQGTAWGTELPRPLPEPTRRSQRERKSARREG